MSYYRSARVSSARVSTDKERLTMTDDTEVYDESEDVEAEENPRDLRSQLREANKRAAQAEKRARKSELMEAVRDAGVSMNGPVRFALNHYDGDTDPEAVKSFLAENEFLQSESSEVPSKEVEAHAEISEAAAGADPQTPPSEDAHYEELKKIRDKWVPGMDAKTLIDEGVGVMQKYGQKLSFGSPGETPS